MNPSHTSNPTNSTTVVHKPSVSVVVPAYNEAGVLEKNLEVVCDYLKSIEAEYDWEMIIVNDGSTDETGDIADAFAKTRENVTVLHHMYNFRLGQALRYAFNNCRGDYVVVIDCDLSYSPDHIGKFNKKLAAVRKKYEELYETRFDTGHSVQKSSTDIIAVDEDNLPFRNPDGSLLFRPAGHGALLENLNDLEADIIFIKNIDNIVPDRLKSHTVDHKKLIGGYLLRIRKKIFDFLKSADAGTVTQPDIDEMIGFVKTRNLIPLPPEIGQLPAEQQCGILKHELNRPIRVCGMVKNEGEPGGGPFWVKEKDERTTLQIVESSQVNMKDPAQSKIFGSSTHFNPVDLVCCTTDYKGNAFNLHDFVDTETGFISLKSSGGKTLKAQELPGLWNGSMAGWITVFAEVPLITFNPVKTINDLLRDEHQ